MSRDVQLFVDIACVIASRKQCAGNYCCVSNAKKTCCFNSGRSPNRPRGEPCGRQRLLQSEQRGPADVLLITVFEHSQQNLTDSFLFVQFLHYLSINTISCTLRRKRSIQPRGSTVLIRHCSVNTTTTTTTDCSVREFVVVVVVVVAVCLTTHAANYRAQYFRLQLHL